MEAVAGKHFPGDGVGLCCVFRGCRGVGPCRDCVQEDKRLVSGTVVCRSRSAVLVLPVHHRAAHAREPVAPILQYAVALDAGASH